jgi:hypothetical protein
VSAQPAGVELLHVLPVEEDLALGGVVQAQQQRPQSALAGTAGPHHGHHLAGGDLQLEVFEDRDVVAGRVAELDVLEFDVALGSRDWYQTTCAQNQ